MFFFVYNNFVFCLYFIIIQSSYINFEIFIAFGMDPPHLFDAILVPVHTIIHHLQHAFMVSLYYWILLRRHMVQLQTCTLSKHAY